MDCMGMALLGAGSLMRIMRELCQHQGEGYPQATGTRPGVRSRPQYRAAGLVEAAEQLHAFSRHVLHDVRVRQVQLD
jgi:hypothetical protein